MQDVSEWQYLPDSFIEQSRNACKLLLFKFLLDEALLATPQKYELRYVAARMVFDAWPFLMERKLSFGIQDKFLSACKHIEKKVTTSERPSVRFIEECLDDALLSSFLKDIKINLSRFTSCWKENFFCPYALTGNSSKIYLETRAPWIDYCFPIMDHCRTLFFDSMLLLLRKRNKNIGDASEYLKNCFGDPIDCSALQAKVDLQEKYIDAKKAVIDGMPEEEYIFLSNIPIDFLFQEKDCIGSCSELLFLEKNAPCDVNVVADVFDAGQFKRKWLSGVADFVKNNSSIIISLFDFYSNPIEIPNCMTEGTPLGLSTKMFLEEYIDRVNFKLSLMPVACAERKRKRIDFFSEMYDPRNVGQETITSLAKKNKYSKERARQILRGDDEIGLITCIQILKGLKTTKNFLLNASFQADFMQLELSEECAFPQKQFDSKYGIVDDKTRQFLFDVTNWKISNSTPSYIGPIVFRNCNVKKVSTALSEVRKFLDDKVIPVSLEGEIVPRIMDLLTLDNQTVNAVCDIIRKSDSFEGSLAEDGEILYSLRWQYLCSIPSRLARILYEFKKPTHLKEIYAEYNRRAKLSGIPAEDEPDWFKYRFHRYIKGTGRLGTWVFSMEDGPEKSIQTGIVSFLEKYIKENNGKVTFNETLVHLRKSGYTHTESSIRAYLGNLCRTVKDSSGNVFVYKPWIGRFKDLKINPERNNVCHKAIPIFVDVLKEKKGLGLSLRELEDVYCRRTGEEIKAVTARAILDKHGDLFSKECVGGGKSVYFLIGNSEGKAPKKKSPNFHNTIKEKIKSILENTNGHCLKMNLIARDVCKFVPKGKHSNIIYTIIHKMDDVEMYEVDGKKFLRLKKG